MITTILGLLMAGIALVAAAGACVMAFVRGGRGKCLTTLAPRCKMSK